MCVCVCVQKPSPLKRRIICFIKSSSLGLVVQWVQAPVKPDHLSSTCRAHVEETKNWLTPSVLLASTFVARRIRLTEMILILSKESLLLCDGTQSPC